MRNKTKIIVGILSAALVYDILVHITNKRRFQNLIDQRNAAVRLLKYYAVMMDENNIPVTEFDLIVVKTELDIINNTN